MLDKPEPPSNLVSPLSKHSVYPELRFNAQEHPTETLISRDSSILACLLCPLSSSTLECGNSIAANLNENDHAAINFRAGGPAIENRRHSQPNALGLTNCNPNPPLPSPFAFYSGPLISCSEPELVFGSSCNAVQADHFSGLGCITTPTDKAECYSTRPKLSGPNVSIPTTVNNLVRTIGKGQSFYVFPHVIGTFQPSENDQAPQNSEPTPPQVPPTTAVIPEEFKSQSSFFRTAGPCEPNTFGPLSRTDDLDRKFSPPFPSCVGASQVSKKTKSLIKKGPIANSKRFPCPMCGQKFARAFNLQTHIGTHAGMRPFSCPAEGCPKAFSRRHDLGRHVGAIHRDWLSHKNLSVAEAVKPLQYRDAVARICCDSHGMIRQKT